jgi:hypothetical protein
MKPHDKKQRLICQANMRGGLVLALLVCPSLGLAQTPAGKAKPDALEQECRVAVGDDVDAFRKATAELPSDESAADVQCPSATFAPICVFKTWAACEYWQEPAWCAAVGVPGIKFDSDGAAAGAPALPKPDAPWALNLQDPEIRKALGRVIGLRQVERDRCYLDIPRNGAGAPAAQDFLGDTELMYLLPSVQAGQEDIREQIFIRRIGQRWQLTGWQNWEETRPCFYTGYEDDSYFAPKCKAYADVHPWALRSEHTAQRAPSVVKP